MGIVDWFKNDLNTEERALTHHQGGRTFIDRPFCTSLHRINKGMYEHYH